MPCVPVPRPQSARVVSFFSSHLENIQPMDRGEKEALRNAGHSLMPQGKLGNVLPLIPKKELKFQQKEEWGLDT